VIHIRELALVSCDLLNRFRERLDLRSLLFVRGRHARGQQMTQSVNHHVDFGALLSFVSVVADTVATLGRRLQRSRIQDHGGRVGSTILAKPENLAQVMHHGLESARGHGWHSPFRGSLRGRPDGRSLHRPN
jgi:hypothetical protein